MRYYCPMHSKWFSPFKGHWLSRDIRPEAGGQTVIDIWDTIAIPPAPELKPVTADPQNCALLILDMENLLCKSPRCTATISNISSLLAKARKSGMPVVYSLIPAGNAGDIVRQLAPLPGEPIVKSSVDKFYKTDLEELLQKKGRKKVIVTGFAANGAVLHTATAAAFRGYGVILPVDCMSANNPYAEQYTAWHMPNSPGTRNRATLTKASMINFI